MWMKTGAWAGLDTTWRITAGSGVGGGRAGRGVVGTRPSLGPGSGRLEASRPRQTCRGVGSPRVRIDDEELNRRLAQLDR